MEDTNTKVLLHFDGADASTTFTDSSQSPHTWTAYGNAQIDAAQKKFGTGAGLFDGTGDYIDTPDSEDFNLGSGDFTIDFWFKKNINGTLMSFCGQNNSSDSSESVATRIQSQSNNTIRGRVCSGGTSYYAQSVGTISDTNWHHLALVRYGNTMTLYIDGVADGAVDVTGVTVSNSSNRFAIGRPGEYPGQGFNGWIDEFRFVKGAAKWTANFTPPTAPYSFGWPGKIFGITPVKIFGVAPKKVNGI